MNWNIVLLALSPFGVYFLVHFYIGLREGLRKPVNVSVVPDPGPRGGRPMPVVPLVEESFEPEPIILRFERPPMYQRPMRRAA